MVNGVLPKTLGDLQRSGYRSRSVKEEMRENLIRKLKAGETLFPGIWGYADTVIRQVQQAVLAKHDILLLGLRGQGKTRLLRQLTDLLDDKLPIVMGSEVNDDPFAPISRQARDLIAEMGDATPIEWIGKDRRYGEKLATPDVSMADLIGDLDPVKALNLKLDYGHEGAIQYGIIPRTNRGIFVINELPDLQGRIQVGLLNILEERDFQIRGFRVRIPLDVVVAFSANPEDYTNRGNIITPLKDRIDSQIITHYPRTLETALSITAQEAWVRREGAVPDLRIPPLIARAVEEIVFQAREDKDYVDQKSGVSARLSISALENIASAIELRGLATSDERPNARFSDLESAVPAITGKLELVYAGEQEGPINTARLMISRAVKKIFQDYFLDPYNKKEREPEQNPYFPIISWFEQGNALILSDKMTDSQYLQALESVPGLEEALKTCARNAKGLAIEVAEKGQRGLYLELILEGLQANGRLTKENLTDGFVYKDMMSGILSRE